MEFRRYLALLRSRWPLIALCALLGLGGAIAYSVRAPRLYRATASLSITPSIIEYWTGQAVERLLNNYALRLKSGPFAERIAYDLRTLQPPVTPGLVMGTVRALASPSDFRITVQVDDSSARRAQAIANAAVERFAIELNNENLGRKRRDVEIKVLDRAGLPAQPFSPRPRRAAAAGLILGVAVGVLAAVLLAYWDDTLKGADEVPAALGLQVIGVIPAVHLRQGARRRAVWRWSARGGRRIWPALSPEAGSQGGVARERR